MADLAKNHKIRYIGVSLQAAGSYMNFLFDAETILAFFGSNKSSFFPQKLHLNPSRMERTPEMLLTRP